MKARNLHSWQLSGAEAERVQRDLARQVVQEGDPGEVRTVAGVDVGLDLARGRARAAVVTLRFPELEPEQSQVSESPLTFPYIPGLLAFRELPAILVAFEQVEGRPDLVMVDGQGIAHPRRLGIASHLGLLLDVPTIGCAKSILVGRHGELGEERGAWSELIHAGEVVGAAVRTKTGTKPIYVSVGHRINLPAAIHWVLACTRGYRLPEPTRQAHLAAGKRGA